MKLIPCVLQFLPIRYAIFHAISKLTIRSLGQQILAGQSMEQWICGRRIKRACRLHFSKRRDTIIYGHFEPLLKQIVFSKVSGVDE